MLLNSDCYTLTQMWCKSQWEEMRKIESRWAMVFLNSLLEQNVERIDGSTVSTSLNLLFYPRHLVLSLLWQSSLLLSPSVFRWQSMNSTPIMESKISLIKWLQHWAFLSLESESLEYTKAQLWLSLRLLRTLPLMLAQNKMHLLSKVSVLQFRLKPTKAHSLLTGTYWICQWQSTLIQVEWLPSQSLRSSLTNPWMW